MKSLPFIISAAALFIATSFASAQEKSASPLIDMKERIKAKDPNQIQPVIDVASKFQTQIKAESLDPAPDLVHKMLASKDILGHLTNELLQSKWEVNAPETESVMASIHIFFERIDKSIEEGYEWKNVHANVSPPPGTPNAAAGMNPEAIKDPNLKQQYLDLIKSNQDNELKNKQQRCLTSARDSVVALASYIANWAEQKGAMRNQIVDKLAPDGKSKDLLMQKLGPPKKTSEK